MRAVAAIVALSTAAPAVAAELPVTLKDGATWTMTVSRERERQRGTAAPQVARFITSNQIVWRTHKDGDRLTTRMTEAKVDGAGSEALLAALGQEKPVELDVDESLTPERIRNWDEVRGGLEAFVAKSVNEPKAVDGVKALLGGMSPELAASVVMRELALVALGQGTALEVGQPLPYEDALPNPLGGPPIQSQGAYELVSLDPAQGRAVVSWRSALDPASMAESMTQGMEILLQRAAPDQADKVRAAFTGAKVQRDDACRHEIDITTGLAIKVECASTIEIVVQGETGRNVDRWTITQSLPKTNP